MASGGFFVLVQSTRILDTRTNVGGHAGPLHDGDSVTLPIAGQTFGIDTVPANAVGVVGNLTVAEQTASGYMVVYPANTSGFPQTSNLDFAGGGPPLANMVVSSLGQSPDPNLKGHVSIRASVLGGGTTHVIFDVLGYTT